MSATIPVLMPDDLLKIVRETASATGLSQQDVIRQSLKIGAPRLVEKLKADSGRITNADPLPDEVMREIYSPPERDEEGVERWVKAQATGGRD